jgi:iron complex transport system permease protein
VSNGINIAILVLVLQFGVYAVNYSDLYYLYATIGGIGVLVLVLLGGKWISGKGRFNVVNMILMGTIMSQLLGVIMTYAQTYLMDEAQWVVYYQLQNATGAVSVWMYITLFVGGLAALVPVILFRFKLNLISFSDDETRLLGVDPTRLRVLALVCGSVMILVAQMNAGQVAMASLIIPFVVRATFGSEFSKQLVGNMLVGALVLLICGFLGQVLLFEGEAVGVSSVVNIVAIPLFVWMMAIRQRSWE